LFLFSPPARLSAGAGQHSHRKLDRALQRAVAGQPVPHSVVIRVKPGARDSVRHLLQASGARIRSEHPGFEAIAADLSDDVLARLEAESAVESISIDAPVQGDPRVPSGPRGATDRDNPLRATLGLSDSSPTGRGVVVALIDSGIDPSPEFGRRITACFDFTRGGVPAQSSDEYGHGTHVAGLIGGSGRLSDGRYAGIAPDVRFVVLKVLDGSGQGRTSDVLAAIEFAIAQRDRLGIDIINLSLGHPIYEPAATDPLVQAVEQAVRGHRRHRRGGELRCEPGHWPAGLRGHLVAGECAVGHHGRRREDQ
jgi:subtilisin family serine protease